MNKTFLWAAAAVLLASEASADDARNLCAAPMPPSANVSPADDAVHLDAEGGYADVYEEWYWNAVLAGGGKTYGLDVIAFQFAFPSAVTNVVQIGLTDVATGEYQSQLVWGGGGYPYLPGRFDLAVADGGGAFSAVGGGGSDHLELRYADGSIVTLDLDGLKNPAPAFFDGFGDYLDAATGKSHGAQYYLQRRNMAAWGTITRPGGRPVDVAGIGWYDRQWGTVIGTPGTPGDNVYWKWFSIHLSDGTDLMVWDMYALDTGDSVMRVVNSIGPAPACREATYTDVTVTALGQTVSNPGPPPSTFDLSNHLSIPDEGLELDVRTLTPNQIIATGGLFAPFVEGAMAAEGTRNGRRVLGTGYYEQFVPPGGCCQSP
jgi:Lipocalin-like domain/CrtC N-terminal lipocalin domain